MIVRRNEMTQSTTFSLDFQCYDNESAGLFRYEFLFPSRCVIRDELSVYRVAVGIARFCMAMRMCVDRIGIGSYEHRITWRMCWRSHWIAVFSLASHYVCVKVLCVFFVGSNSALLCAFTFIDAWDIALVAFSNSIQSVRHDNHPKSHLKLRTNICILRILSMGFANPR